MLLSGDRPIVIVLTGTTRTTGILRPNIYRISTTNDCGSVICSRGTDMPFVEPRSTNTSEFAQLREPAVSPRTAAFSPLIPQWDKFPAGGHHPAGPPAMALEA